MGAGRSVPDTLDVPPSPGISLNCNQRREPHNEIPSVSAFLSHRGRPSADVPVPKTVVPALVTFVPDRPLPHFSDGGPIGRVTVVGPSSGTSGGGGPIGLGVRQERVA